MNLDSEEVKGAPWASGLIGIQELNTEVQIREAMLREHQDIKAQQGVSYGYYSVFAIGHQSDSCPSSAIRWPLLFEQDIGASNSD